MNIFGKTVVLNPLKTRVGKKVTLTVVGVLIMLAVFHIADTYFNRGPAEDNLRAHIVKLFGHEPYRVSCANIDTSNTDSRVTCEALLKENDTSTKVYLCKGFLDGFDSSCIAPKLNKLH